MLQVSTLQFLQGLKANNSKVWMDDHRSEYRVARADFVELVRQVLAGLVKIDAELAHARLEPKKCLFSINRDVRLSLDKSPYKTSLGAWFNLGGKAVPSAGYYLAIEPGASLLAGGMHLPPPRELAVIRQEIDYDLPVFERLVQEPAFQKQFGSLQQTHVLKRPPKGYRADNPAIEHLKLKSFIGSLALPDHQLVAAPLTKQLLMAYQSLHPLVRYLNRTLTEPGP